MGIRYHVTLEYVLKKVQKIMKNCNFMEHFSDRFMLINLIIREKHRKDRETILKASNNITLEKT